MFGGVDDHTIQARNGCDITEERYIRFKKKKSNNNKK